MAEKALNKSLKNQKANSKYAYKAPQKKSGLKILNVGDSRTVGMGLSVGVNCEGKNDKDTQGNEWFAKTSQGLAWFKKNIANIKLYASDCDVIVINLGVNDVAGAANPENTAQKYITEIKKLHQELSAKGKKIIFTSCNPIGNAYKVGSLTSTKANSNIDKFNAYMKENLPKDIGYIDTNSYVKKNVPQTAYDREGLHYNNTTNKKIYDFILKGVKQITNPKTLAVTENTQTSSIEIA